MVDYYYKSMIAAIVVAVVVGVILLVLVALYLKRNITYKAIISGRGNRAEMGRTNKVNFNERKLISTKKITLCLTEGKSAAFNVTNRHI